MFFLSRLPGNEGVSPRFKDTSHAGSSLRSDCRRLAARHQAGGIPLLRPSNHRVQPRPGVSKSVAEL
ncbi:hypothetical protein FQA47_018365 [Oryzias melastigma]|uniref:Uncharacterized protein n=1 Tax=Oryzias melastigma TaxID=30732 RepID=A0A834CGX8_ORYME|nr:hypothetical protein FQA47_018365 [Oryzias melastigma]